MTTGTSVILEGTGQELSDHFRAMGAQHIRVLILPELPKPASYSLDEFDGNVVMVYINGNSV